MHECQMRARQKTIDKSVTLIMSAKWNSRNVLFLFCLLHFCLIQERAHCLMPIADLQLTFFCFVKKQSQRDTTLAHTTNNNMNQPQIKQETNEERVSV